MNLKRSVLAATAALSLALGAAPLTPAANAADVTPEQVADGATVGEVKPWDVNADPPLVVSTKKPQDWIKQVDNKSVLAYKVSSPSMERDIPVAVIPATDANGEHVNNAPTIYLLNGAGGAEQNADWLKMYKTRDFFTGKGVNVVIPQAGAFTYYTDWLDENVQSPYISGPQKWETFLTKELPGPIEDTLKADNRRAIVGFSMSGTSALVLPARNPGFYDAAASFSGCAATSSPHAYNFARVTINRASGTGDFKTVTPEQMWGPMGGEYNRDNDALLNADKLRGTALYISTATGLAGQSDQVGYLIGQGAPAPAASVGATTLQVEGGVIEAAINKCSHDLRAKLEHLNIPATYEFRNAGTHSWPYWREDIQKSWYSTIAPAFGM
ncbi:alpha/beta hydrolase [Corynebacterium sanguinis]|uniref:alpha/beta hydrolase n=1 Tax=Corynebacterium sanguinis TaxID=2594913 RepID=UPI0011A57BAF|nr:alpha/beta hydrolase family protein [Corynebacterium sanguinis]MCT1555028.1 esterase family protein [Corynebacterium sanguinis]MCT1663608.1 esterase family protein [Corynebacterium sanguinis]MCT1805025.1 esterase family protein [Corynebacterium sanguinis]MCT2154072.1 esterase family protein [Corynebacterium sanguinis]MCT2158681.1 esterase family protein [Corynebacterium sanguinis]